MRDLINNLRKEAETTLRSLFALKQFRLSITCRKCTKKINQNSNFWRLYESAIRTNLFIGIRRLYENEGNTLNFQRVIAECRDNVKEFSKDSLRQRKMAQSANASEWIDEYIETAYEPSQPDFDALSRIVRQNSKRMKGVYTTVASTIFAHAVHVDYPAMEEKMRDLNFAEMETALNSIWHVYNQLWQIYENGRKPEFEPTPYPYQQEVFDSVAEQIGCRCEEA